LGAHERLHLASALPRESPRAGANAPIINWSRAPPTGGTPFLQSAPRCPFFDGRGASWHKLYAAATGGSTARSDAARHRRNAFGTAKEAASKPNRGGRPPARAAHALRVGMWREALRDGDSGTLHAMPATPKVSMGVPLSIRPVRTVPAVLQKH
jgi:hypothetical protein